jgi:hypothetical protein
MHVLSAIDAFSSIVRIVSTDVLYSQSDFILPVASMTLSYYVSWQEVVALYSVMLQCMNRCAHYQLTVSSACSREFI